MFRGYVVNNRRIGIATPRNIHPIRGVIAVADRHAANTSVDAYTAAPYVYVVEILCLGVETGVEPYAIRMSSNSTTDLAATHITPFDNHVLDVAELRWREIQTDEVWVVRALEAARNLDISE